MENVKCRTYAFLMRACAPCLAMGLRADCQANGKASPSAPCSRGAAEFVRILNLFCFLEHGQLGLYT